MPEKLKINACLGPFTTKSGNAIYVACAESPNTFGVGWSTIRWKAIVEKPIAVSTEVKFSIRTLDVEKGEGQFNVR